MCYGLLRVYAGHMWAFMSRICGDVARVCENMGRICKNVAVPHCPGVRYMASCCIECMCREYILKESVEYILRFREYPFGHQMEKFHKWVLADQMEKFHKWV